MSIDPNKSLEPIRSLLLEALDLLIDSSDSLQTNKAVNILSPLLSRFTAKEQLYSIESLVFGIFVKDINSPSTQANKEDLLILRDELLGRNPHWHSYAIKDDFAKSMNDLTVRTYKNLCSSIELFRMALSTNTIYPQHDVSSNLDDLLEDLHSLCYHDMIVSSLSDLIVSQAGHIILSLPTPPKKTFDILDPSSRWGTFGLASSIEKTETQLDYVESLIQKIEGRSVLFVDIHIHSEGFVINLR